MCNAIIGNATRVRALRPKRNDIDSLKKTLSVNAICYRHCAEYSRFQSEANVKKINQKEKVTLKDLQEVMRAAPQFKEKSMRFQLHLELIEKALKEFDARDLDPVANLEQVLGAGIILIAVSVYEHPGFGFGGDL